MMTYGSKQLGPPSDTADCKVLRQGTDTVEPLFKGLSELRTQYKKPPY